MDRKKVDVFGLSQILLNKAGHDGQQQNSPSYGPRANDRVVFSYFSTTTPYFK